MLKPWLVKGKIASGRNRAGCVVATGNELNFTPSHLPRKDKGEIIGVL